MDKQLADGIIEVGRAEKPFDVFLLKTTGRQLVGLKSPAKPGISENEIPKKCCLIGPEMVLGELLTVDEGLTSYKITFNPLKTNVVAELFAAISSLDDLCYPLLRLVDGKELVQPPEYWTTRAADATSLDSDEELLRYSATDFLKEHLRPGDTVYDPACSTGAFLAHIKKECKWVTTIGQDINPAMIDIARTRVDKVYIGDSRYPACTGGKVKAVICRHLNLDVVTSTQAKELFTAAAGTLCSGGYMIVLGHTPILLSSKWMEDTGLQVLKRCAFTPSGHMLFQMYIFQK